MTEQLIGQDVPGANRWLKLAGVFGIVFLVTFLVQFVAGPQAPEYNAKTSDILSYYSQNQTSIELVAWLVGLFGVLYGVFLAGVWSTLRQTSALWLATLGLVAGVSNTILLFVGQAINVAVASYLTSSPRVDASVITPLFKTASLLTMLFNAWNDGLSVLAFSVAILLSGIFLGWVRWIAWAGVFSGAMFLIGGLAVIDAMGPAHIAPLIGVLPWFVWIAGLSIRLIRGTPDRVDASRTVAHVASAR
jgi:hypothetical protein